MSSKIPKSQSATKPRGGKRVAHRGSATGAFFDRHAPARGDVERIPYPGRGDKLADRINQVREGLPVSELTELARLLTISRDQLAEILGVTMRTLQRKAEANERLGAVASDRLARVKRIHELATHVLGEPDNASRWLTTASRHLGGEMPLTMLDTDIGTQRVEQELHQIRYSMPA